jgi:putative addiction module component (TIGR02574 family)
MRRPQDAIRSVTQPHLRIFPRRCTFRGVKGLAEIGKAVLALPIEQRILLAESLLNSLPPEADEMSEAAEIEEAERRDREIETGQAKPLTDEEFHRRIQSARKR